MHKRHKYLISLSMLPFALISCGNREVSISEVVYNNETQTVLFEGKPFTGKVIGDIDKANKYAIIDNGKVVDIIETMEKANGYKKIVHQDNSTEYYDYDGNRISKSEYETNN